VAARQAGEGEVESSGGGSLRAHPGTTLPGSPLTIEDADIR
jgi:hypothetical protein